MEVIITANMDQSLNGMLNKHMGIIVRFPQTLTEECLRRRMFLLYIVIFDSVLWTLDFIYSVVGFQLSLLGSQLPLVWITMGAEMMPLSEYTLFLLFSLIYKDMS